MYIQMSEHPRVASMSSNAFGPTLEELLLTLQSLLHKQTKPISQIMQSQLCPRQTTISTQAEKQECTQNNNTQESADVRFSLSIVLC